MRRVAMISGHLDLTQAEFDEHYRDLIEDALNEGCDFVVGDAKGADAMAQDYLSRRWLTYNVEVTVYHMFTTPRHNYGPYPTKNAFTKDTDKDAAMTTDSDFDIAWVRPEKHSSVSGRVSGTEQNLIRRKANPKPAPQQKEAPTPGYKFARTSRGFRYIEFTDFYGRQGGVQESSLATESLVWLGLDGDQRMHITQEDARKLAGILQYFADIGELPDSFEALQD